MENFKQNMEAKLDNISDLLYSFIDQAKECREKTDVLQTAFEKVTDIKKMLRRALDDESGEIR